MRASYNGIIPDFQSDDVGSIPSARSMILEKQDAIDVAIKLMDLKSFRRPTACLRRELLFIAKAQFYIIIW